MTMDTVPAASSFSPTSGSGFASTFSYTFMDASGASNILDAQIWLNSSAGYCALFYYAPANTYYLETATGGYWAGSGTPGSSGLLSNGICSISLAQSPRPTVSGTQLTGSVYISFSVATTFSEYLSATNAAGTSATNSSFPGWTYFGTWTSPPYASYSICNSSGTCGQSGLTFNPGDSFTLHVYTNMPNTQFGVCINNNYGCTQPFGTTDSYGNWYATGTFSSGQSGLSWQEYLTFPTVNSNNITFAVN